MRHCRDVERASVDEITYDAPSIAVARRAKVLHAIGVESADDALDACDIVSESVPIEPRLEVLHELGLVLGLVCDIIRLRLTDDHDSIDLETYIDKEVLRQGVALTEVGHDNLESCASKIVRKKLGIQASVAE